VLPSDRKRPTGWEIATVIHVGAFLAAATWAFGGNADWVRRPLALLGSVGALITLAVALANESVSQASRRPLWRLWPLAFYNLLVLISLLSPGFRAVHSGPDTLLVPQGVPVWKPSAAIPSGVPTRLWLFDVSYLSCFNLYLVVRHRRALRGLLLFAVGNALALAVFGTMQKLVHAGGLFFGAVQSPQGDFFASFVYHNHWGAFMVLMSAIGLGLARHYGRLPADRGFFQSLAFGLLVGLLLLTATVPLSGSRSCALLLAVLLVGSFLHWIVGLVRERRERQESAAAPLAAAVAAILLACAGIWFLDREIILARIAKTQEQIANLQTEEGINQRLRLYRDTWRMAEDRPWFGWGMGSFPHVFMLYNTQAVNPRDNLPKFYYDAHNDWIQSLAENGFIGSSLLGLCALVPLWRLRRRQVLRSSIPLYLFCGCGLILLYAWVEFPFGNVAVVLSWWLCFFCAVRYAHLLRFENGGLGQKKAAPAAALPSAGARPSPP